MLKIRCDFTLNLTLIICLGQLNGKNLNLDDGTKPQKLIGSGDKNNLHIFQGQGKMKA